MADQWLFKSETYDNCNCAMNCGCQFNLPSTHGYFQSLRDPGWEWQPPDCYRGAGGGSSGDRARSDCLRRGMQTLEQYFLRFRAPARRPAKPCSCQFISRLISKIAPEWLKYRVF